jgi:hypothetical protein
MRLRTALLITVGISLLSWHILLFSGFWTPAHQTHRAASAVLLVAVACSTIYWLRSAFDRIRQHDTATLVELLALFLLCTACFSNTMTGYFEPVRFLPSHPGPQSGQYFEFMVLHQFVVPGLIGLLLWIWFWALALGNLNNRPRQKPRPDNAPTPTRQKSAHHR